MSTTHQLPCRATILSLISHLGALIGSVHTTWFQYSQWVRWGPRGEVHVQAESCKFVPVTVLCIHRRSLLEHVGQYTILFGLDSVYYSRVPASLCVRTIWRIAHADSSVCTDCACLGVSDLLHSRSEPWPSHIGPLQTNAAVEHACIANALLAVY